MSATIRLAIVGTRSFTDYQLFKRKLLEHFEIEKITEIISGGAGGFPPYPKPRVGTRYARTHPWTPATKNLEEQIDTFWIYS